MLFPNPPVVRKRLLYARKYIVGLGSCWPVVAALIGTECLCLDGPIGVPLNHPKRGLGGLLYFVEDIARGLPPGEALGQFDRHGEGISGILLVC